MPSPGRQWYHVTIGTYGSWLPGDPRGFRDRNHELHSSGDHRHPPSPGEHFALHRHQKSLTPHATTIPTPLRPIIGVKLANHLRTLGHEPLAISISARHAHLLVNFPDTFGTADHEIGRAKQAAALAVREAIKGKLWAKSCGIKPVVDRDHHRRVYEYIQAHAAEGAWVWTFRDPLPA